MPSLRVSKVVPCRCDQPDHARVILREPAGTLGIQVPVDGPAGRAILAELNDIPGAHTGLADALTASLQAVGAQPAAVLLACKDQPLRATLRLRRAAATCEIAVDPSAALVLAARLRLPVLVDDSQLPQPAQAGLPAVYHTLLQSLPLNDLGPDTAG